MKKHKIIIVENDEDEQLFMKQGFDDAGLFEIVAIVKNGNSLFEWLAANDSLPDFILSDLNMPGKNGYDIITEVKETPAYAQIPVVITSTSSAKSIMDKCYAIGAAAYIVKPETFLEYVPFVRSLHHLVEERRLVPGN